MKNIITLFLLSVLTHSIACCGYGRHQFYPVGESNESLYFLKLELSSNCKNMSNRHNIEYRGQFKIIRYTPDSNYVLQEFDTFRFENESPDSNTTVINTLQPYYDTAFAEAKKIPNLKLIHPVKYTSCKENINRKYVSIPNDTIAFLQINQTKYRGNYSIWGAACGPRNKINEVKEYKFGDNALYIVNIGCRGNKEYKNIDKLNQKQFERIDKALTFISYRWHGFAEDVIIIKKNEK